MAQSQNPVLALLARLWRGLLWLARMAWRALAAAARAVWPVLKVILRRIFEVLFALVLIFEEWGWRPLAAALAQLARYPLIARLEAWVAGLPPYGALAVFVLPSLCILPLKLLAVYLIATGHALLAGLLFLGAKVVGTALVARIYMLTHEKLMQIGWFARGYNWLMPWKDRMFDAIRASWVWRYGRVVKYRVGNAVRAGWVRVRPQMMALRDRVVARVRALLGK